MKHKNMQDRNMLFNERIQWLLLGKTLFLLIASSETGLYHANTTLTTKVRSQNIKQKKNKKSTCTLKGALGLDQRWSSLPPLNTRPQERPTFPPPTSLQW